MRESNPRSTASQKISWTNVNKCEQNCKKSGPLRVRLSTEKKLLTVRVGLFSSREKAPTKETSHTPTQPEREHPPVEVSPKSPCGAISLGRRPSYQRNPKMAQKMKKLRSLHILHEPPSRSKTSWHWRLMFLQSIVPYLWFFADIWWCLTPIFLILDVIHLIKMYFS